MTFEAVMKILETDIAHLQASRRTRMYLAKRRKHAKIHYHTRTSLQCRQVSASIHDDARWLGTRSHPLLYARMSVKLTSLKTSSVSPIHDAPQPSEHLLKPSSYLKTRRPKW